MHDYARSGSAEPFGATQPPVNSGDQIRIEQDAALQRYALGLQADPQQIDHILVSTSLQSGADFDIVHLNTGQPASANGPSDHDPTISSVESPRRRTRRRAAWATTSSTAARLETRCPAATATTLSSATVGTTR